MTRYWLTPIVGYSPLSLGAERLSLFPQEDLDTYRQLTSAQHPRLLPLFKASLLLSDDEDVCGSDDVELDLTLEGDLIFDGVPYHLSHCAEAFLDRLLSRQEVKTLLLTLLGQGEGVTENCMAWTQRWLGWLDEGYDVVLFREDGH